MKSIYKKPNPFSSFNLFSILLFSTFSLFNFNANAQSVKRTVKETLVSKIGLHEYLNQTYTVSSNLKRIAFRIIKNGKFIAVIDTLSGQPYDEISVPVFSSDAERFAYSAKEKQKWQIVVDNKQHILLDSGITVTYLSFARDNKKLIYTINNGKKSYLVYNGIKSKPYDGINDNSITHNDANDIIAYSVTRNSKQHNVIGGVEGPPFDKVGFPVFSPNGKKYAYWANTGKNYFIINNGIKSKPYEAVGTLFYSSNSEHLLFDVKVKGKYIVVVDSKKSKPYEKINSYVLSPDGSRIVYAVTNPPGDKHGFMEYVVVDNKTEGPYEQVMVGSMQFSPNGKDLAYSAQLPLITTVNGVEAEVDSYEWFIVRNGVMQPRYNMLPGSMQFSPDGQKFAYGAEKYIQRLVNINGKEGAPYDDIFHLCYTLDSKHIVYTVKLNNKEFVVVDDTNGNSYDEILGQKSFILDNNNSFHYLVRNGDNIFLIEERID